MKPTSWKEVNSMTYKEFAEYLNGYSEDKKGEIAWLTKCASARILALVNRVDESEKEIAYILNKLNHGQENNT